MPKVSERYFIVDGQHAFVPADHPGLYWLTHPSVLVVDCDHCEVKIGERCVGNDGKAWATEVHYTRRARGVSGVRKLLASGDRIGKLRKQK